MSGSGSGGGSGRDYSVDVGVGGASPNVCNSIDVETILNSPNRAVVEHLKKNAELDVAIAKTQTQVATLVAKDKNGRIAGSLTPPNLITIINCIEGEYHYVAVVMDDVKDGLIRVRIRRKG
jgi:hypothetical protein